MDGMSRRILVVENDQSIISLINEIGTVYGAEIHIEHTFDDAKKFFENNECILALQEIILDGRTSVGLFDIAKNESSKNFETPIGIISGDIEDSMTKRIRHKVFSVVKKPLDKDQLEKVLKINLTGALIIQMGAALKQMKFTEQIMVIEGLTEVIVKLSTISTGFLKEDKPYDSKAANAAINEFMMIVSMEENLKPESSRMINKLENSVRTLYDLLETGTLDPLSSWMVDGIFTFFNNEDLVVAGQEDIVEEVDTSSNEESTELTPEQIDALMNGGGASEPEPEAEAEEGGNLTQEQIEALLNQG